LKAPHKKDRKGAAVQTARVAGATLATGATFVLAAAGGLVLHLDIPVTRRVASRVTNEILLPVFQGRLTIESLGRLGLDGIDGARVSVTDPSGKAVLSVAGVHGRIALLTLVHALLGTPSAIEVDISDASIDQVDLRFDTSETGALHLASAFTPKPTLPSLPPSPSHPVHVVIEHARIHHAWVHGQPTWAPFVDSEVDNVDAKVDITTKSVRVDVHSATLAARALPLGATGGGEVHGYVLVPSEHGHPVGIVGAFRGVVAGVDQSESFSLDGNDVSAVVDLRDAAPDKVRAFVVDYPLQDVVSAHVVAHGTLPLLDIDARAEFHSGGSVVMDGQALLSSANKNATIHAKVAAINLRGLAPGMPVSNLGASVAATLALDSDATLTGETTIDFEGGTVGKEILPPAKVRATFAHGARFGNRADATVTARDPGIDASAVLHVIPRGKSYVLGFEAKAQVPRLDAMRRIRLATQGSAVASAHGTLALDTFALAADLDAEVHDLRQAPLEVKTAHATAHLSGTVFSPRIDATLHADSVDLGGVHADVAEVTAKGPLGAPHVKLAIHGGDVPEIDAEADVRASEATILREVSVGLTRNAERVEIHADTLRIAPDAVRADEVSVLGLGGAIHGQLRLAPHALEVQAEGHDIDVARAARIAGLERHVKSGRLSFVLDGKVKDKRANGRVTLDVADASFDRVNGATGHAEVTLEDRRLNGHAHVQAGDLGTVDLHAANLTMGNDAASLRSWQHILGSVELNAHLDLAHVAAALPEGAVPFGTMRGLLDVSGKFGRVSIERDTPYLSVSAKTTSLVLSAKGPTTAAVGAESVHAAPTWRVEGVDLGLDGRIDGESGFSELAVRLVDVKGTLLALDAKSTALPFSSLFAGERGAKNLLQGVSFDAQLIVPKHELSTLPSVLKLGGTGGELEAEAEWHGTLADPSVNLHARLDEAHSNAARLSLPVDLDLASHYAGGHAEATLAAIGKRGHVLDADARFEGRPLDLVRDAAGAAWEASLHAHLEAFPLGAVGSLEDRQIRGHVTGDVTLTGLHRDAKATVDFGATDMQVGEVIFKEARLRGALDGHALDVTARVDHGDGSADGHARMGATWGASLLPRLDAPADFTFSSKQLRAETLLPFVRDSLAELEGRIDANAHMVLPATGNAQMDGKVAFDHGKVELASAFGEFHDVAATLSLTRDGIARLENARAYGVTGMVEAAATARFNGLALAAARANIEIPSRAPVPLTLEGTPIGSIDGSLEISEDATADRKGLDVVIAVPTFHVLLPDSGSRSVQGLGTLDSANIGVRRTGNDFELVTLDADTDETRARPADAKHIEITGKLGGDVELRRGKDLKIGLEGQPTMSISDKVRVAGQIRLKAGGMLSVQGKAFEIERGTVTFVGDDPSNPQVVVTASWRAPEGTIVYADYIGPLKSGKVTLRSEPRLEPSEITALLISGTTDAQTSAQSTGNTEEQAGVAGVSLAGGAAAQPINHALDQFGLQAVTARVDTSQSAPKPEVEVQIARDISAQLAIVVGTPPPGSNPDLTWLTLNWHFLKAWSLATTVGSSGSSILDVVWQRRY
jgi:translocation and assembly module TamB